MHFLVLPLQETKNYYSIHKRTAVWKWAIGLCNDCMKFLSHVTMNQNKTNGPFSVLGSASWAYSLSMLFLPACLFFCRDLHAALCDLKRDRVASFSPHPCRFNRRAMWADNKKGIWGQNVQNVNHLQHSTTKFNRTVVTVTDLASESSRLALSAYRYD
jgi:hypothetical protein